MTTTTTKPFARHLEVTPEEFCSGDFSELENYFGNSLVTYYSKIGEATPQLSGPYECSCTSMSPLTVECTTNILADESSTVEWVNWERAIFRQDGTTGRYILDITKWCNTNPNDETDQYCEETEICDDGESICTCRATDCGCDVCPGGNFISVTCPSADGLSTDQFPCSDELSGPFSNNFEFEVVMSDTSSATIPFVAVTTSFVLLIGFFLF